MGKKTLPVFPNQHAMQCLITCGEGSRHWVLAFIRIRRVVIQNKNSHESNPLSHTDIRNLSCRRYFEISVSEGRGGEKGGDVNIKNQN